MRIVNAALRRMGYKSDEMTGNWRMTFEFEGENALLVDYQDYH